MHAFAVSLYNLSYPYKIAAMRIPWRIKNNRRNDIEQPDLPVAVNHDTCEVAKK